MFPTTYCVPEIGLYCAHFSSADMFCGSCLAFPPERLLNHENQGLDCCHRNEVWWTIDFAQTEEEERWRRSSSSLRLLSDFKNRHWADPKHVHHLCPTHVVLTHREVDHSCVTKECDRIGVWLVRLVAESSTVCCVCCWGTHSKQADWKDIWSAQEEALKRSCGLPCTASIR